jgi:hypothetical protein
MNTFHIEDTIVGGSGFHGSGRADRFRREAELHRLLKGSGTTRRPSVRRRLAHALNRR